MPFFTTFVRSLLAAAALTLLLAAPAAAAPAAGVQLLGIQRSTSPEQIDKALDNAKRLGVKIVRTELTWAWAEPQQGTFDEAYLAVARYFVDGAASRGMKTMLLIQSSPCWASAAPDKSGCSGNETPERVMAFPPRESAMAGPIYAEAARRYGSKLAAIEVWNEPDHRNEAYFGGPDKPQRYASLLRVAYKSIKGANKNVKVLGGAIVGANGEFLKALYKAGIKGHYDALSVHYYDLVLASLRAIRQTMRANGDRKPVWLGEFGYTSCAPGATNQGGHACVTPAVQGKALADVFRALRTTSYVQGVIVYTLDDTPRLDFGLVRLDGTFKSAFGTLQSLLTKKIGAPRTPTVKLRRKGGRVVVSGSGPAADAFEVDVFKGGRLRYKATFRLDRNLNYRLTLPGALGTRGLKVRVYQYWTGRGRVRSI